MKKKNHKVAVKAIAVHKNNYIVKPKFFDCVSKFIVNEDAPEEVVSLFDNISSNAPVLYKGELK